jgi:hypothetical protein
MLTLWNVIIYFESRGLLKLRKTRKLYAAFELLRLLGQQLINRCSCNYRNRRQDSAIYSLLKIYLWLTSISLLKILNECLCVRWGIIPIICRYVKTTISTYEMISFSIPLNWNMIYKSEISLWILNKHNVFIEKQSNVIKLYDDFLFN